MNFDIKSSTAEGTPPTSQLEMGQWRNPARDPIAALHHADGDGVLALIVRVEGPSYRPVGTAMAVLKTGQRIGSLSSGCIEADIAVHARDALIQGSPKVIRYGRGSPYMDIQLPCGGGMDILLVPHPDPSAVRQVQEHRLNRRACALNICLSRGAMEVTEEGTTHLAPGRFSVRFDPELQFLVFGKGPEATTFAKLVQSVGFPNMLLSPDCETLDQAVGSCCATRLLLHSGFPDDLIVDNRTAVVLFFHEHDWEPPVLIGALATDAFYIGAQGSIRARDSRRQALDDLGVRPEQIARLKGPVGLIPSARDATTLAVSVLAEILAQVMPQDYS
ncbi:XdhC family protein [Phaeobacter italicus]|uniref:XdhC family protein n=1 Tax=Phaeobacter italicus TaxID=481446 RepID=UPI002FDA684B